MSNVLVDSSQWISYLQSGDPGLEAQLIEGKVLAHPFVIGELCLGQGMPKRRQLIQELSLQEWAPKAEDEEVVDLVERYRLPGSGIGWVDAHLIASARLAKAELLTKDKALQRAWERVKKGPT